ncbi:MAG: DUF2807 domain-containing protein [Paludibacter sp.]|nr:DUF2807 domain-containing protein [Paludibacter sp.]
MKKTISPFLFLGVCVFCFSSCASDFFGIKGKGNIVTESEALKVFSSVELTTSADVQILKSDSAFSVEVSDYENIIQYLSTKVVSNALVISTKPATTILQNSRAKVIVRMPDNLKSIVVTGSGTVQVDSSFISLQSLALSGSGDIKLNDTINIVKLTTNIMGSGNISAKGKVVTLVAGTSGSGTTYLSNLIARDATCTITGSGSMYVNATGTLKAAISGSGSIEYSGSPTVTTTITGSGTVKKK